VAQRMGTCFLNPVMNQRAGPIKSIGFTNPYAWFSGSFIISQKLTFRRTLIVSSSSK
jgi:hypothetical protein